MPPCPMSNSTAATAPMATAQKTRTAVEGSSRPVTAMEMVRAMESPVVARNKMIRIRKAGTIRPGMGICWTMAVLFVVLGAVFLIAVSYKPIYDARETANIDPPWQECHLAMTHAFPGLLLGFMEAVVLASISVAISTRLPMMANFIVCFTIYALGHLTPATVQSTVGEFEAVAFIGQLIATIVPNLENFDIQAAITRDTGVPYHYLFGSLLYCILYGTVAMLLALVMFEDRDLA